MCLKTITSKIKKIDAYKLEEKSLFTFRCILYLFLFLTIIFYLISKSFRMYVDDLDWSSGIVIVVIIALIITHLEYLNVVIKKIVGEEIKDLTKERYYEKVKDSLKGDIEGNLLNSDSFIDKISSKVNVDTQPTPKKTGEKEISLSDDSKAKI